MPRARVPFGLVQWIGCPGGSKIIEVSDGSVNVGSYRHRKVDVFTLTQRSLKLRTVAGHSGVLQLQGKQRFWLPEPGILVPRIKLARNLEETPVYESVALFESETEGNSRYNYIILCQLKNGKRERDPSDVVLD